MNGFLAVELQPDPKLFLPIVIYAELLCDITAPFFNLYFLFLLRRPFFHLNLRLLLGQFSLSLILMSIARILLAIDFLCPFLSEIALHGLTLFNNLFIYAMMDISVLLSCERIIATVFTSKYEKFSVVWLTLLVLLLVWIGNLCMTMSVYVLMRKKFKHRPGLFTSARENDTAFIICSVVMLFNVLGVLTFLFIRHYNLKRWKTALAKKLSFRYQVMENVRTAKQVLIVMCAAFALSAYLYFTLAYILISRNTKSLHTVLIVQIQGILVAIFANLLPCLFIKTHPKMWAAVKRHLKRGNRVAYTISITGRSKSLAEAESKIYFDLLAEELGCPCTEIVGCS